MTVTIYIEDRTAQALQAQADAVGLSLEQFVQRVLTDAAPDRPPPRTDESVAGFDQALDTFFASAPPGIEASSTWSRSEIYIDHD